MTTWRSVALAVALTGCLPFGTGQPTLRPGSNVAVGKKPSVADVVAKSLLCSVGVNPDTTKPGVNPMPSKVAQQSCATTQPVPVVVPDKKP